MKFGALWIPRCTILATTLILLPLAASAQPKQIRLRAETITTTPAQKLAAVALAQRTGSPAQAPASGLFLVQLESRLEPAERKELSGLGVALIKYVPEDAFIAVFNNASADKVRALSYVRRRLPTSSSTPKWTTRIRMTASTPPNWPKESWASKPSSAS